MPVFHKAGRKILFVHIPKTGGTFVEYLFKKNSFHTSFLLRGKDERHLLKLMHCSPQHLHWSALQNLFDTPRFDYRFALVRHPLERFISEYRMRTKNRVLEFNAWALRTLDKHAADPYLLDNHLRPQVEFLGDGVEIFRLEDGLGDAWLSQLSSGLGLPMRMVTHDRPERSRVARSAIAPSAEVLERIQFVYSEDYQRLGYSLDPCRPSASQ